MRIVNFKKFIRSVFILFTIILILSLFITKSTLSHTEIQYKTIYVSSGDTLWSIAQNLQDTEYYQNKDIRDVVYDLMEKNALSSSSLYTNQELKIPTL